MKIFIRLVDLKSIYHLCLPTHYPDETFYSVGRFEIDLLFISPTLFCIDETFHSVGRFEINLPPMSTNLLYATQTSTVSTFIIQVVLLEIIASALNKGCCVCPDVR